MLTLGDIRSIKDSEMHINDLIQLALSTTGESLYVEKVLPQHLQNMESKNFHWRLCPQTEFSITPMTRHDG